MPGLAVTVKVGVLPHEAVTLSVSAPTVATMPFERLMLKAVVLSTRVPVPALQVVLAVTVMGCEVIVADVPLTVAVPLTLAVSVNFPFWTSLFKTVTVAFTESMLSRDRLSGMVCCGRAEALGTANTNTNMSASV